MGRDWMRETQVTEWERRDSDIARESIVSALGIKSRREIVNNQLRCKGRIRGREEAWASLSESKRKTFCWQGKYERSRKSTSACWNFFFSWRAANMHHLAYCYIAMRICSLKEKPSAVQVRVLKFDFFVACRCCTLLQVRSWGILNRIRLGELGLSQSKPIVVL